MPAFAATPASHRVFLDELQALYAASLPEAAAHFPAIEAFWLEGQPLPSETGGWLARQAQLEVPSRKEFAMLYQSMRSRSEYWRPTPRPVAGMAENWQQNLLSYFFTHHPAEEWSERIPRLRTLMLPLVPAAQVWALFSRNYADLALEMPETEWKRGLFSAICATIEGLEAEPVVTIRDGGKPASHLSGRDGLQIHDQRRWLGFDNLSRWFEVFFSAEAIVLGRRYVGDSPRWWMRLFSLLGCATYNYFPSFAYSNTSDAFRRFHRALVDTVVDDFAGDTSAVEALLDLPDKEMLRDLIGYSGLLPGLLPHPQAFALFLRKLSPEHADYARLAPELAKVDPEAWLAHSQTVFRLTGKLEHAVGTGPKAAAWYREILPQVKEPQTRNQLIKAISDVEGVQALIDLVLRYLWKEDWVSHSLFESIQDPDVLDTLLLKGGSGVRDQAA